MGAGYISRCRTTLGLACVTALALLAPAASHASTVIGQSPLVGPPATTGCTANVHFVQLGAAVGPDYRVPPGGGVITEWHHQAGITPNQSASFSVFAGDIPFTQVTLLVDSPLQPLTPGVLNSFPVRIPVSGGERIGLVPGPGNVFSCFATYPGGNPGDTALAGLTPHPVGTTQGYVTEANTRISIAAVLEADADKDQFGDESQDSCPVDGSIQVPCAAVIDKGPKKKTSSEKARFNFSVPAGTGISFECALDKDAFAACASGIQLKKLKPRKHTFHVRAKDGAGAVGAEAQYRWRVTG